MNPMKLSLMMITFPFIFATLVSCEYSDKNIKIILVSELKGQLFHKTVRTADNNSSERDFVNSGVIREGGIINLAALSEIISGGDEGSNVLKLVVGNTINGSAESHFTKGMAVIQSLAELGYQAIIPGSLDMVLYPTLFNEISQKACDLGIPILALNLVTTSQSRYPGCVQPAKVVTVGDKSILIIGFLLQTSLPNSKETDSIWRLKNGTDEEIIPYLQKFYQLVKRKHKINFDYVIVLTSGNTSIPVHKNIAKQITNKLPWINMFIFAHDGAFINNYRNQGHIEVLPLYNDISTVYLTPKNETGFSILSFPDNELINYRLMSRSSYVNISNTAIKKELASVSRQIDRVKKRHLSYSPQGLEHYKNRDSPVSHIITDTIRENLKNNVLPLDIPIIIATKLIGTGIDRGDLSKYDTYKLLPQGGKLYKIKLSISSFITLLNSYWYTGIIPFQVSENLRIRYNTNSQVVDLIYLNGREIDPNKDMEIGIILPSNSLLSGDFPELKNLIRKNISLINDNVRVLLEDELNKKQQMYVSTSERIFFY